jgi:hypothetical protein
MKCLFCEFEGDVNQLKRHYTRCKEHLEIKILKDLIILKKITEKKYLKQIEDIENG